MVSVIMSSQRTVDTANNATRYSTDNTAHKATNRAESMIAGVIPSSRPHARTCPNSLSLGRDGAHNKAYKGCGHHQTYFHRNSSFQVGPVALQNMLPKFCTAGRMGGNIVRGKIGEIRLCTS